MEKEGETKPFYEVKGWVNIAYNKLYILYYIYWVRSHKKLTLKDKKTNHLFIFLLLYINLFFLQWLLLYQRKKVELPSIYIERGVTAPLMAAFVIFIIIIICQKNCKSNIIFFWIPIFLLYFNRIFKLNILCIYYIKTYRQENSFFLSCCLKKTCITLTHLFHCCLTIGHKNILLLNKNAIFFFFSWI